MIDPALLRTFDVVQAFNSEELDARSSVSERLPGLSRSYKYRLRDRALWRLRFDAPVFSLATRYAGHILMSYGASRFATNILIDREERHLFSLSLVQRGTVTLMRKGEAATATETHGLAFRAESGSRLITSDDCVRTNLFIKVEEVESALEHMLDDRLRHPLEFWPTLEWGSGLANSLKWQLEFLMQDFQRPDGVASNPVALASVTDLLVSLMLRGMRHNYAHRLDAGPAGATPAYVRRAEDFMRANGAEPIRMAQVASAAGCSLRTLGTVFQRFRGTTPLSALHAIRLEQAHAELSLGTMGASIADVARHYGFTNPARFALAFRRRFGEKPADTVRRGSRS